MVYHPGTLLVHNVLTSLSDWYLKLKTMCLCYSNSNFDFDMVSDVLPETCFRIFITRRLWCVLLISTGLQVCSWTGIFCTTLLETMYTPLFLLISHLMLLLAQHLNKCRVLFIENWTIQIWHSRGNNLKDWF